MHEIDRNVSIKDVYIDTGDDAISIKAVGPGPCTDVRISHATLISRNFAVGEHTTGGISNILMEDSRIGDDQGSSAWGIKFKVPGTGVVENITLRRITLGKIVAKSYYGGGGGFALSMAGDNMRNISITDVVAQSVVSAGSLEGSVTSPLVGLVLRNITLVCAGSKLCRRFGCKDVESSDFTGLSPVLRPKCHTVAADPSVPTEAVTYSVEVQQPLRGLKSDDESPAPRVASPCLADKTQWDPAQIQQHLRSVALDLYADRSREHYSENMTLRWEGIADKMCPPRLPGYSDCSSFVTYIYWTLFGDGPDFMNGENWTGGSTRSLKTHGVPVGQGDNTSVTPDKLLVGDLLFYYHPMHHVAM